MSYSPPNPGAYTRKITIQQQQPITTSVFGTPTPSWGNVVQTWARIAPFTYQSTALDNQPIVHRNAKYTMRRIPSIPINIGMRIVDTTEADVTQTWTILDVQDVKGARRELLLICQLVVPDQGV